MKLLIKVTSQSGKNTVLPTTFNKLDNSLWNRLHELLKDLKYSVYVSKDSNNKLICNLYVNCDTKKLLEKIPELNKKWISLIFKNIVDTPPLNMTDYTTIIEVSDEYLSQSEYFTTLLQNTTDNNNVVPLPTSFELHIYDYIFDKAKCPEDLAKFDQYYFACDYYDLKTKDLIEYSKKIIEANNKYTGDNFITTILKIKSKHKQSGLDLHTYMRHLCETSQEDIKNLFINLTDPTLKRMLYTYVKDNSLLFRHNNFNVDFILPDFYEQDLKSCKFPINPTFADFEKKYSKISELFFDHDFDWTNKIIAGGLVLECIASKLLNKYTDIDFYVLGTEEERKQAIIDILKYVTAKFECYFASKGSVIYIYMNDYPRPIQIINGDHVSALDVISDFDHTCCQAVYTGSRVLCTYDFLEAIRTGETKVLEGTVLPERLYKMISKGFTYTFKDADEEKNYKDFTESDAVINVLNRYYQPRTSEPYDRNCFMLKNIYKFKKITSDMNAFQKEFDFTKIINKYNGNNFLVNYKIIEIKTQEEEARELCLLNIVNMNDQKFMYKLNMNVTFFPFIRHSNTNTAHIQFDYKYLPVKLCDAIKKFDVSPITKVFKEKHLIKKNVDVVIHGIDKEKNEFTSKGISIKFDKLRLNGKEITTEEYHKIHQKSEKGKTNKADIHNTSYNVKANVFPIVNATKGSYSYVFINFRTPLLEIEKNDM